MRNMTAGRNDNSLDCEYCTSTVQDKVNAFDLFSHYSSDADVM